MSFSDSRTFSRTFTAGALVLGSVLHLVSTVLDPAWADDSAAYLRKWLVLPIDTRRQVC